MRCMTCVPVCVAVSGGCASLKQVGDVTLVKVLLKVVCAVCRRRSGVCVDTGRVRRRVAVGVILFGKSFL